MPQVFYAKCKTEIQLVTENVRNIHWLYNYANTQHHVNCHIQHPQWGLKLAYQLLFHSCDHLTTPLNKEKTP